MRNKGRLRSVEHRLIEDLKESTLSFGDLGKRYGVSKQAIFAFCRGKGIKRPKRDHVEGCPICQSLIRISKKPHSDFISTKTLEEKSKFKTAYLNYHIRILKKKELVSKTFGRLRSKRAEWAYQVYFKKRLPVRTIGRQAGFKNFYAVIKRHRALGWDVPDPLFKYDSNDRRKTIAKMNRKKKRAGKSGRA